MKTTAVKPMKCEFAREGLLWIDKIATGVGIIVFNPKEKLAAGVHVLRGLSQMKNPPNPAYFADTAIDYVLDEFRKRQAHEGLSVAIAGGSAMLSSLDNVGSILVSAIKEVLASRHLVIKLESVGGTKLRTMILNIDDGKIKIS